MSTYLFTFLCIFFLVSSLLPLKVSSLRTYFEREAYHVNRPQETKRLIIYKIKRFMGIIGNPFVIRYVKDDRFDSLERRLRTVGNENVLNPSEFFGFKFISALIGSLLSYLIASSFIWIIPGFLCGYFYPDLWLREALQIRQRQIQKDLPFALDLITVSVEAGLGFESALEKVVEKGKRSPLTDEFFKVLQEIRVGKSRCEALQDMAIRIDNSDIRSFVSTLIQAERLGTSISTILRVLSEQYRTKRSQRAEAAALKAPVKMLFPLAFCIFPTLLLLLLGPVILRNVI